MKAHTLSSRHLRFPAAIGFLLLAAGMLATASNAQFFSEDSASKVIRLRQGEGPRASNRQNRGVQNRISPKRRAGKEGSAEAKIDAEQARALYIRRKSRLAEI